MSSSSSSGGEDDMRIGAADMSQNQRLIDAFHKVSLSDVHQLSPPASQEEI